MLLCLSTGATDLWNTDNPQVIVYRDGQMFGTMDLNHNRILLEERAAGGETVGLSFYAYSNSAGRTNFFDVSLCALDREIDQLYYDLKVLWDLADLMGDEENGRLELEDVLNRCVNLLDLRDVSGPDFAQSVKEAEAFLQTAHYSAERPLPRVVVHGIGHTHIDVAWKMASAPDPAEGGAQLPHRDPADGGVSPVPLYVQPAPALPVCEGGSALAL